VSTNPREFTRLKKRLCDAILHDKRLSRTGRAVGYEIADYLNYQTGDAWPSQEIIARRVGCCVRTVERVSKVLAGTAETDGLWFSREIDGASYRYIPKFDRLTQPNTRQNVGYRHPTIATKTPDIRDQKTRHNVGLSSLREPNREPTGACGQVSDQPASPYDQVVERGMNDAIPFDQEITAQAVCGGAPSFVFEGSKPWHAWVEYRAQIGIPGRMPVRRHMVNGRWRSGWDAPTLYPPGYRGPKSRRRG
jgi:hypothetical protein